MSKKTIQIEQIKNTANLFLADNFYSQEQKKGIKILLEYVLHASDNYKGFSYNNMNKINGSYEVTPNTEYSRSYF